MADPRSRAVILCTTCGANANPPAAMPRPRSGGLGPLVWAAIIGGVALVAVGVLAIVVLSAPKGQLEPGATWVAHSDDTFSIEFPVQPATSAGTFTADEQEYETRIVSASTDGVRFEVRSFAFERDTAGAKVFNFAHAADALALEIGRMEKQTGATVGGVGGSRVEFDPGDYRKSAAAMVASDQRVFLLICDGFSPKQAQAAQRFFDSFVMKEVERREEAAPQVAPLAIRLVGEEDESEEEGEDRPSHIAGAPLTLTFEVTGGNPPYRIYIQGLIPLGLRSEVRATTFRVTGVPCNAGASEFTVVAEDAAGIRATRTQLLEVKGVEVEAAWGQTDLPAAVEGTAYTGRVSVKCVPSPSMADWHVDPENFPPGLRLAGDVSGASVLGTPQRAGTYSFELRVTLEVPGAEPVELKAPVKLIVHPAAPKLAEHVRGSTLVILQASAFDAEVEAELRKQLAGLVSALAEGETIAVRRVYGDSSVDAIPTAQRDDERLLERLRTLAMQGQHGESRLGPGIEHSRAQGLEGVDTVLVITGWTPENPQGSAPEAVSAALTQLVADGKRVVMAMQSSPDSSKQSLLPEDAGIRYARFRAP